ncbi:MAG: hypothetical protein KDK39_15645 [Leptospiraceae bacterium]|nr:hypothetical protein [Leptospiraceae bacterium]
MYKGKSAMQQEYTANTIRDVTRASAPAVALIPGIGPFISAAMIYAADSIKTNPTTGKVTVQGNDRAAINASLSILNAAKVVGGLTSTYVSAGLKYDQSGDLRSFRYDAGDLEAASIRAGAKVAGDAIGEKYGAGYGALAGTAGQIAAEHIIAHNYSSVDADTSFMGALNMVSSGMQAYANQLQQANEEGRRNQQNNVKNGAALLATKESWFESNIFNLSAIGKGLRAIGAEKIGNWLIGGEYKNNAEYGASLGKAMADATTPDEIRLAAQAMTRSGLFNDTSINTMFDTRVGDYVGVSGGGNPMDGPFFTDKKVTAELIRKIKTGSLKDADNAIAQALANHIDVSEALKYRRVAIAYSQAVNSIMKEHNISLSEAQEVLNGKREIQVTEQKYIKPASSSLADRLHWATYEATNQALNGISSWFADAKNHADDLARNKSTLPGMYRDVLGQGSSYLEKLAAEARNQKMKSGTSQNLALAFKEGLATTIEMGKSTLDFMADPVTPMYDMASLAIQANQSQYLRLTGRGAQDQFGSAIYAQMEGYIDGLQSDIEGAFSNDQAIAIQARKNLSIRAGQIAPDVIMTIAGIGTLKQLDRVNDFTKNNKRLTLLTKLRNGLDFNGAVRDGIRKYTKEIAQQTRTVGRRVPNSATGGRGIWDLPPLQRGAVAEANPSLLPGGRGGLPFNHPVIDGPPATSVTTIDLSLASYQSPSRVTSRLLRKANDLVNYPVGPRQFRVGIPSDWSVTTGQRQALDRVTRELLSRGVTTHFVPIR